MATRYVRENEHLIMEEAKKLVEVYIEGLRKQAKIETFF